MSKPYTIFDFPTLLFSYARASDSVHVLVPVDIRTFLFHHPASLLPHGSWFVPDIVRTPSPIQADVDALRESVCLFHHDLGAGPAAALGVLIMHYITL